MKSAKEVIALTDRQILDSMDPTTAKDLSLFIEEMNRREHWVRIEENGDFDDYVSQGYNHIDEYGHGFVAESSPVPYFAPNRSHHDEIIWLNRNLYYNEDATFEDRLINSAIVKFYGPSKTLEIITKGTPYPFVKYDLLKDDDYLWSLMANIELAFAAKTRVWGTTELRTSLQTASRNYARERVTPIDKKSISHPITRNLLMIKTGKDRKMRVSDMIFWIAGMADDWIAFYSSKPDMEASFNFLTSYRGIGNYYGYHFSSNLARMPEIGAAPLIEKEFLTEFTNLQVQHGNIDENSDYVMAGPGAMKTLEELFPNFKINTDSSQRILVAARDNQPEFFGIRNQAIHEAVSELGQFTTFGCEIACCQFSVFQRLRSNLKMATSRAKAPISKEVKKSSQTLESFL